MLKKCKANNAEAIQFHAPKLGVVEQLHTRYKSIKFHGNLKNECIWLVGLTIDTIGHAQGIGNKMIVLYTPCPFLWFLINFLRRKIVLWLFSDRCSDFSSSCCLLCRGVGSTPATPAMA